jgi:hypothetical protein
MVVLAAIVLVAVKGLVDVPELKRLWRSSPFEFGISMVAFVAVLLLGILKGVLLAAVVSLLMLLKRAARPHVAFLGLMCGWTCRRVLRRYSIWRCFKSLVKPTSWCGASSRQVPSRLSHSRMTREAPMSGCSTFARFTAGLGNVERVDVLLFHGPIQMEGAEARLHPRGRRASRDRGGRARLRAVPGCGSRRSTGNIPELPGFPMLSGFHE